jgi:multidrug resistance efflux pump
MAEHIHTATCYRERLDCAVAKIQNLEQTIEAYQAILGKAQIRVREAGGLLDQADADLDRGLKADAKS